MTFIDLPPGFLSLLLAIFGLVLGSFANVLIYRLPQDDPKDRNVATKSSHCPSCKAPIHWYHNIPVFAWLFLRGRCAACGWRIPYRYPLVELLSGLIFAASPWLFPFGSLIWFKGVICAYALLVLFFTDLTEFILPDAIQYPLMVLGVLFALPQIWWPGHTTQVWLASNSLLSVDTFYNGIQMAPGWRLYGPVVDWQNSLIGLVVGYGGPALFNQVYKWIKKTDGLGMGDFKMLAWLGAFWGWAPMLGILFGGAILGTLFALPLLITRRATGQTMLPFGCAMAVATPFIVFYGPALLSAYLGLM